MDEWEIMNAKKWREIRFAWLCREVGVDYIPLTYSFVHWKEGKDER